MTSMRSRRNAPGKGRTQRTQFHAPVPRLPNERDASADSQQGPPPSAEQRQAAADVERGVVDTDRGPVLDRLYNERFKPRRGTRRAGTRRA